MGYRVGNGSMGTFIKVGSLPSRVVNLQIARVGVPSLWAVCEEMVREGAGDLLFPTPSAEQDTEA